MRNILVMPVLQSTASYADKFTSKISKWSKGSFYWQLITELKKTIRNAAVFPEIWIEK